MRFGTDNQGNLYEMHYQRSSESYIFVLHNDNYQSWQELREPDVFTSYREGVIKESLFTAGRQAALPDKVVMELANIFGWDIDFVLISALGIHLLYFLKSALLMVNGYRQKHIGCFIY